MGLAFREDALEEIVGPLGDEFDDEEPDLREVSEGVFEIRARMSLPELEGRLGFDIPEEEREEEDTLGGHVIARLGRLPREGDTVRIGPYEATVVEASPRRVRRLRLVAVKEEDGSVEA